MSQLLLLQRGIVVGIVLAEFVAGQNREELPFLDRVTLFDKDFCDESRQARHDFCRFVQIQLNFAIETQGIVYIAGFRSGYPDFHQLFLFLAQVDRGFLRVFFMVIVRFLFRDRGMCIFCFMRI